MYLGRYAGPTRENEDWEGVGQKYTIAQIGTTESLPGGESDGKFPSLYSGR